MTAFFPIPAYKCSGRFNKGEDDSPYRNSGRTCLIASLMSSIIPRVFYNPFDVIKIRHQFLIDRAVNKVKKPLICEDGIFPLTEIEHILRSSKPQPVMGSIRHLFKTHGLKGLYRGHFTSQVTGILHALIFHFLHAQLRSFLSSPSCAYFTKLDFFTHIYMIALSSIAITLTYPLDLIKTRLISQDNDQIYKSIFHAFRRIFEVSGFRGLYRGLLVTILGTPSTNILIALSYRKSTETLSNYFQLKNNVVRGDEVVNYNHNTNNSSKNYDSTNNENSISSDNENNMNRRLHDSNYKLKVMPLSLLITTLTAVVVRTIAYPLDTIRRYKNISAFKSNPRLYFQFLRCEKYFGCAKFIYGSGGLRAFYLGYGPATIKTLIQIPMQNAIFDLSYSLLQEDDSILA